MQGQDIISWAIQFQEIIEFHVCLGDPVRLGGKLKKYAEIPQQGETPKQYADNAFFVLDFSLCKNTPSKNTAPTGSGSAKSSQGTKS